MLYTLYTFHQQYTQYVQYNKQYIQYICVYVYKAYSKQLAYSKQHLIVTLFLCISPKMKRLLYRNPIQTIKQFIGFFVCVLNLPFLPLISHALCLVLSVKDGTLHEPEALTSPFLCRVPETAPSRQASLNTNILGVILRIPGPLGTKDFGLAVHGKHWQAAAMATERASEQRLLCMLQGGVLTDMRATKGS